MVELLEQSGNSVAQSNQFIDNGTLFDVFFIVSGAKVAANRLILATESTVFHKLLYDENERPKKVNEVQIDAALHSFQLLIKHLWKPVINLEGVLLQDLTDLYDISCMFNVERVKKAVANVFVSSVKMQTAMKYLELAFLLKIDTLKKKCWPYIEAFIEMRKELKLTPEMLLELLGRQERVVSDANLFPLILTTISLYTAEEKELIFNTTRFSYMTDKHLLDMLLQCKVPIPQLIEAVNKRRKTSFRQKSIARYVRVFQGDSEIKFNRFRRSNQCKIDAKDPFVFDFGIAHEFNQIKLHLSDWRTRYSYYVEVSNDRQNWVRVVDFSNLKCWSIQKLSFTNVVAQYIRVTGRSSRDKNALVLKDFPTIHLKSTQQGCMGYSTPTAAVSETKSRQYFRKDVSFWTYLHSKLNSNFFQMRSSQDETISSRGYKGKYVHQLKFRQPSFLNTLSFELCGKAGGKHSITVFSSVSKHSEVIYNQKNLSNGLHTIKFNTQVVVDFIFLSTSYSEENKFYIINCQANYERRQEEAQ